MEKNPSGSLQETTTIVLYNKAYLPTDPSGYYSDPEFHYLTIAPATTGNMLTEAIQDYHDLGLNPPLDYTAHCDGSYSVYITGKSEAHDPQWWVENIGSELIPRDGHAPSPKATGTPTNSGPGKATFPTSTYDTPLIAESHITVRYLAPNGSIVQKSYTSTQTVDEIIHTLRSSRASALLPTLNKVEEHMFQEGVILHFPDRIHSETLNDALGETLTPIS